MRRVYVLILAGTVAAVLTACGGSRAFLRGERYASQGEWDLAVKEYRVAYERNPGSIEYRSALIRAQETAATHHYKKAKNFVKGAAGITRISMTTNGLRLAELAVPLKQAGLERVNVSVDTLDPDRFHRVTRWGHLDKVLDGGHAAEAAGLTPIKINAVIARGFNEQDIADLARLTLRHPWQVRFIEMMPFGDVAEFAQDATISQAEIMARIEAGVGPLHPIAEGRLDGEARLYRLEGAQAAVGFISTLTNPFCASDRCCVKPGRRGRRPPDRPRKPTRWKTSARTSCLASST